MPPKSKKVEDKNQSEKKNAKKLKDELDEIDRELEKINAEEEKKEEKKAEKTAMKTGEFEINNQTIEIFNNLMNYYNSTNSIKCSIEDEKKSERIRRYYKSISTDEKQKNYLLKRNKLLFYKNKDTEILPKINLYAALKSEEQDDIIEKLWDNLILLYLSCEENSKNKDDTMFENLNKAMEDGSLGKMFENLNEEVKKMDISQMFEKLKFNTNPEAKAKTTNMLSDMISKLTDNMVEISKSENPQDALMSNLHNMAADYSKLFESGEVDFMSFLSAVPEILSNPKELTKNIDLTKLEGIKLPDLNSIINSTQNVGEDALKGSTDGKKAAEAFSKMFGGGANPMGDILKGMMSGGKDGTNPMADIMKGMMSGGKDGANPMADIMKGMLSGGKDGANPMADIMKGMMSGGKDGANPMADIMKNMMSGSGANGGANPMMDMMKNMISGASSGGDGANPMADIMKNMMSGASANGGANPMMDMVKNMMTGGGGGGGGGGGLGALGALGALGGLGGEGGITNSLNKMTGGALDNVLASVIENQGSSMLEKMAADAEESKNKKPLTPDQIKELEEYLANQKIN
jgi:hypothetical protein